MYYNANMKIQYRKINKNDKKELLDMMRIFYSSNALYTNGSEEIFNSNFENALNNTQYLECYFIVSLENVLGYVLLAKSYSTEFGRECIWLEDLYLKEQYRGKGIIPDFISYIKNKYPNKILRLEVEQENKGAIKAYQKSGFKNLPYLQYYYISNKNQ